jgi:carboxypeptidase T
MHRLARIAAMVVAATALAAPAHAGGARAVDVYRVTDVRTAADRADVVGTGVAVSEVDHGSVVVTASRSEVRQLRALGYRVSAAPVRVKPRHGPDGGQRDVFPSADGGYHDYAEMSTEVASIAAANPDTVSRFSIGRSFEGRELWAVKISDNVATDEGEPEVLFTASQHAREHLTVEMALYLLNELTSKYGSDSRVKDIVDSREIYIVFNLNPDGSEYDIADGSYRYWRKNRQPTSGSTQVGTDLNRNWAYNWGCCGGSSADPESEIYRGTAAFSAPETAIVRDFVNSRVVGGAQQIKAGIDFHTYGELVLWPFGHTYEDTATGMSRDEYDTFAALGRSMASSNGFTPEQSSDLYITDGSIDDWLWGVHRIFGYTFELYPRNSDPGFYPPDEVIAAETSRNREAALRLLEYADCPYRAIAKEVQHCGAAPPDSKPQSTAQPQAKPRANTPAKLRRPTGRSGRCSRLKGRSRARCIKRSCATKQGKKRKACVKKVTRRR